MVYVIKMTGLVDYDTISKITEIYLTEDEALRYFYLLIQNLMELPTGDQWYKGFSQIYQIDLWSWDTQTQEGKQHLAKHAY